MTLQEKQTIDHIAKSTPEGYADIIQYIAKALSGYEEIEDEVRALEDLASVISSKEYTNNDNYDGGRFDYISTRGVK